MFLEIFEYFWGLSQTPQKTFFETFFGDFGRGGPGDSCEWQPGSQPKCPWKCLTECPRQFSPSGCNCLATTDRLKKALSLHNGSGGLEESFLGGFEKGWAGGGWRQTNPQKSPKSPPEMCPHSPLRGHRKKGTEKRPESLAFEGFLRANPLCPPTPFRNFWLSQGLMSENF